MSSVGVIVLAAQILSSAAPLSPEQAVAVVRANLGPSRIGAQLERPIFDGPQVVILGSSRTDAPPWHRPIEDRRLDGTRWIDPPLVYGQPPWPSFAPPGAYPATVFGAPYVGVGAPVLPCPLAGAAGHDSRKGGA
jgi:hypothetical protein